jgi:CYTH domain-containing protein
MLEIERKYLVNEQELSKAVILEDVLSYDIQQAYLSTGDTEIRVRRAEKGPAGYECYMTIKSKGDLVREEIEFDIPYSRYRQIIDAKVYKGNIIDKRRYKIYLGFGLIAELDIFKGLLDGLMVVEVEFPPGEQAKHFVAPAWFGEEITYNAAYKNKNLIMRGEC